MSDTDLSFSSLGCRSPTESTEHNESSSMPPLSSSSLIFEIISLTADANFSHTACEIPVPAKLQIQRTKKLLRIAAVVVTAAGSAEYWHQFYSQSPK